jgi:eukaryotic-like serine/threonine-protein kinase
VPEGRVAYVEDACAGDPELGAAVASMLAGADAPTFLETPAAEFVAPLLADLPFDLDTSAASGSRIGPYRLLREIGHGGMGTVYLAERADQQYQRLVAVKLLRGWSAGNERAVRRFLEERQILAALDHPDIARLFDGGVTPDRLPWFAMEYVEGVPLDRYCDERGLPIEERLELFCRVCAAVQFAHRNLVVHRDLKPANILVTAQGGVRLLDFGIAKLLSGDGAGGSASLTITGERLMTPLYASPEQVRGDPISTASDIYSLGVLLYELLTGVDPYRLATREPHEVAHAILEQEPERPSAAVLRTGQAGEYGAARGLPPAKLARRLRGDLDTIVLTTMQKDPGHRYGTADQLEADVRRHLAGLPLLARPESRLARAQKFVRRHRVGVGVTAVVALLVVAFAGVTAIQSLRIRTQAGRITVERDRAEQVSRFLAGLFQTSDPYAGAGGGLTARQILDSGAARIDRELAGQPQTRAQMLLEMGRAYFGLGVRDRARRFAETSLAIQRRTSPDGQSEISQTLDFLGLVLLEQGELEGAERVYREALALRRQHLGPDREMARTLNGLAAVLRAGGRFRDADSVSREAVTIDEAQSEGHRLNLAESLEGQAHAVRERGDFNAAERLYGRVLELRRQELPEEHPEVASSVLNLATALSDAGQTAGADSLFRSGLAVKRRLLGVDHPDVAVDEAHYARLLHRRGNDSAATTLYRHALSIARRQLPGVHPLTATTLLGLGELWLDQGKAARAEPLLREAYAIRRTGLPPGHPYIAEAEQAMGAVIMAQRRYVEAERYLRPSFKALQAAYGDADPRTQAGRRRLIALYDASGQPRQADLYRAELEGSQSPGSSSALDTERSGDTSAVAVFPFRITDQDPALADLRDVVQDLLAVRLRLAGQLGARWLLRGDISGSTRRVSLDAVLLAVPNGATLAQARVEGSADSLPYLADRLVARLLAIQAARDSDELAALTGTSPSALRAYLAGRQASRRGQAGAGSVAAGHFERALFLDSTFVLAGLRLGEIAAAYGMSELDERWKLDAIWRQRDRLGPADRALLVAYLGPRYPRPATLSELIAAGEQAARSAPYRAEAWHNAGLTLFRFGSTIGYPGWEAQAGEALRRAVALDSTDAFTLDYLLLLAAATGDRAAVRQYAERHPAHNPAGQQTDLIRWVAAIVLGDSAGLAEVRSRFVETPRLNLRGIVHWSETLGVGLEDADRAARLYDEGAKTAAERRGVMVGIVPFMMNRGRPGEASRLLATAERGFGQRADVGVLEFRIYAALYWDGDPSEAAAAARSLGRYLDGAPMRPGQVRDPQTAACALAHWRLAAGDLAGAEAALRRMRRFVATEGLYPIESTPTCAAAAEAQLATARHRPDATALLARLDTLLRAGSDVTQLLPRVANVIAARLYEGRGDLLHALACARRRAFWWNQLLSTQLREEGRLAALAGDRAGAVEAYRHYLALRSDPEPGLRPEVEQVRRELQRVEGR